MSDPTTHIIPSDPQSLKRELAKLDTELTKERDALTKAKRERDQLRADNSSLRQKQGFVNSDLLVQDFEQRKVDMTQMHTRLVELKDRHEGLTMQMQQIQVAIEGAQPVQLDGEMGI